MDQFLPKTSNPVVAYTVGICLLSIGCGTKQSATQSRDSYGASTIVVPDVLEALSSQRLATSYDENPAAAAEEVVSRASAVITSAGLRPQVELQPIVMPDSQTPSPGTRVPPRTPVSVKIGFGD